jgi:hypothetical protein
MACPIANDPSSRNGAARDHVDKAIALIEEVAAVNDGQSCTRAVHGHTGRLKASFVAKFIRFVVWWSGSSSRHGAF